MSFYVHPITLNCNRERHAVCAVDNHRVVVSGGTDGSHALNTMELFDIRQTSMGQSHSGSIVGGRSANSSSSNNNRHHFDSSLTSSMKGTLLPNLPKSKTLTGHESAIHGDHIYIIGGYHSENNFDPLKTVYRFNISTIVHNDSNRDSYDSYDIYDSMDLGQSQCSSSSLWERMQNMNEARQDFSSTVHKHYIYVFGGYNNRNQTYLSSAERYNTLTNQWEILPPMTTDPRASHSVLTVGDNIYILGGRIGTHALQSTEVFDTVSQSYTHGPDLLCPLYSFSAVAVEDWIVLTGGRSDDSSKAVGESFIWNTAEGQGIGQRRGRECERKCNDDDNGDGGLGWRQTRQKLILPRKDHAAIVLDDTEIVVLGGSSGNGGFTFDSIESIPFQDMDVNDDADHDDNHDNNHDDNHDNNHGNNHDNNHGNNHDNNHDDNDNGRNETTNSHVITNTNDQQRHEQNSVTSGYNETWYQTPVQSTTPTPDNSLSELTQSSSSFSTTIPRSLTSSYHFDIFLSHNWGRDDMGRDNHQRVNLIKQELNARGITTWFDTEHLSGNIVDEMTAGIEKSMAVIVFVTQAYITKASGKGPKGDEDNCKLEFSYARRRKTSRNMIPVVMEDACCETSVWTGTVGATLGDHLHFRFTRDDQLSRCVDSLMEKIENIRDN